eukprot:4027591-Amphidinium_carterae.1
MVNAMVGDRLSCAKDAKGMLDNSEELVALATSRKRKEQGALPEGQTKLPRVEIDGTQKPSNWEPEGIRDGKLADTIIVLPSIDHRPSGDGERDKKSLGGLQPSEGRRQSSGSAERLSLIHI